MNQITPYQAAIEYINMGLAVFPLVYKGKTPLTKNGCKDATTDAAMVKMWWQKWPNANVGIATGTKSGGLLVIDLDIDEDKGINGYQTLRDWERENKELPTTAQSITGRGGYHLFYKCNRQLKNRAGVLEGVDIRGEGGYIVAPPSVHQNENQYEWEYPIDEYPIALANETVFKLLNHKSMSSREFKVPEVIGSGKRNETMFKYACSLQAKGLTDEAIIAAMKIENEKRCSPPLEEEELLRTIESALRFDKGVKPDNPLPKVNNPSGREAMNFQYHDNGKLIQNIHNICEVLRHDQELKDKVKYNLLSYSPFVYGTLPWETGDNYREWSNSDDSNLKCYIEAEYGFKSMDKIMEALNIVVYENKFNPVVEYLEQLKWDGEERIHRLLSDYLGVEKDEYSAECMKLFMLGAIHRAYKPGCKFDYMPVLVGEQGVGKSTFFKILAGNDDWYNDNFNTVDGDKAAEKLRGMWIVELAELLAVKRSQAVESIKAFLTSTVDTYRPPYGRRTEQRPRVCVFAGTTNNTHFLTDRTGNRRYLPLLVRKDHVKKSMFDDREAVKYDFEQAWAEAMNLYGKSKGHPKLILPRHLDDAVKEIQASFTEEDVRIGIIQEWLDRTKEERVCVAMLYERALGYELQKPERRVSNELHDIMRNSIRGWQLVDNSNGGRCKLKGYGPQICYERVNGGFIETDGQLNIPF